MNAATGEAKTIAIAQLLTEMVASAQSDARTHGDDDGPADDDGRQGDDEQIRIRRPALRISLERALV